MRVALVSEHASPLAVVGAVDAGGQNVHVDALAAALVAQGHDVTVHTRRDDPALPEQVDTDAGYRVLHVPAGPAAGRIVAVRQGNLLATSFHPEVTGDARVHEYFVQLIREAGGPA